MTTSYTLTGDFNDLLGEEASNVVAWLETNLPAGTALVDLDANKVLLAAPKRIELDANNAFSISAIATNSTGTNVTDGSLRYRVRAQYTDGTKTRQTWDSGTFELTAAADLSDKVGGAGDLDVTIAPSASLIDAPTAANVTGPSQTKTALDAAYAASADFSAVQADVTTLLAPTDVQGLYQRLPLGSFRALAVDPNVAGRVWGVSSAGMSYMDNDGTSARVDVGAMPSSQSGVQLEFTSTHAFLVTSGNGSRLGQVWRSPVPSSGSPSFTWTKIFDLTGFTTTLAGAIDGGENSYFREQSLAIDAANNRACVLEYGTTVTGGPSVYYSANITVADTSMLWTKRQTFTSTKHGHGIAFINGAFWAMLGDATFTNLGLWRGDGVGASWLRRSIYGEAEGGNTLYGINLHAVTINDAPVILTDNDTKRGHSILMFPSQSALSFPLVPLVTAKPPYNTGTVRSIRLTSEGNLMWVQTGENATANAFDSIWISRGPDFREAVLLEAIPSENTLGTLGKAVESGNMLFVGTYRLVKEKFAGQ